MGERKLDLLDLPEETREILERYLKKVLQEWGDSLEGLYLYGSAARGDFIQGRSNINVLGIFQQLPLELLQKSGRLYRQWGKHQIVAPLMMTEGEVRHNAQCFPLEFLQLMDHHVLLQGRNSLSDVLLDEEKLRWQCRQEIFGNLLRVRQRFIEGEGRIEAIQTLLILSITSVLPCIRGILRIVGEQSKGLDSSVLERLEKSTSFEVGFLVDVLHMKRGLASPGKYEWPKLYGRYLEGMERLYLQSQEWCT